MKSKHMGLVPLRNFGILDSTTGLYRSAQPLYKYEYGWLKEVVGIKTIINLRKENIGTDRHFCRELGMNLIPIAVQDHRSPTLAQCHLFMHHIKDPSCQKPLLIHCEHGHGRTSTFCVLARVAMGWDLEAAIREEEERFHYHFKHPAQKEFLIKNFSHYGESE